MTTRKKVSRVWLVDKMPANKRLLTRAMVLQLQVGVVTQRCESPGWRG